MQACYKAADEVFDETMAKNASFKKVFEPWKKFRDEEDPLVQRGREDASTTS